MVTLVLFYTCLFVMCSGTSVLATQLCLTEKQKCQCDAIFDSSVYQQVCGYSLKDFFPNVVQIMQNCSEDTITDAVADAIICDAYQGCNSNKTLNIDKVYTTINKLNAENPSTYAANERVKNICVKNDGYRNFTDPCYKDSETLAFLHCATSCYLFKNNFYDTPCCNNLKRQTEGCKPVVFQYWQQKRCPTNYD